MADRPLFALAAAGLRCIRKEGMDSFWRKFRDYLQKRRQPHSGDATPGGVEQMPGMEEKTSDNQCPPPDNSSRLDREYLAGIYLKGSGLEIGACHVPLKVPQGAHVIYVDKFTPEQLRKRLPELETADLVDVDIIDDGELLKTINDGSQDFVIANHFLEHCQDPIGAIENMLRVLKPGGILFMAVPDMRYTFDVDRPVTHIEHLLRDHSDGGANSRRHDFEEFIRYVGKTSDDASVQSEMDRLLAKDASIHYHAWTQVEIVELILTARKTLEFNFEIELAYKQGNELVVILSKPSDS